MVGRKPKPTAMKIAEGNRGKRRLNTDEPKPPDTKPTCPSHLSAVAKTEWRRIAGVLHDMGVLTTVDRAALAGYCQAYGRWVEAERKLAEGPTLIRTPSGYVQQSPWLSISNKAQELMGRYMAELGITPASRSRIAIANGSAVSEPLNVEVVRFSVEYVDPPATEPKKIEHRISGSGDEGVYSYHEH